MDGLPGIGRQIHAARAVKDIGGRQATRPCVRRHGAEITAVSTNLNQSEVVTRLQALARGKGQRGGMIHRDLQTADHGERFILGNAIRNVVRHAPIRRVWLGLPLRTATPLCIGTRHQWIVGRIDEISRAGRGLLQGVRANGALGSRPAQRVLAIRVGLAVIVFEAQDRHTPHVQVAVRKDLGDHRRGCGLAGHGSICRHTLE